MKQHGGRGREVAFATGQSFIALSVTEKDNGSPTGKRINDIP